MEAGQKPDMLKVGFGADADFCVGVFEDPEDPKHLAEVEAALANLEKTGMVESSPGDRPGERLYTLTEKGRKRRGRA